ncbi:hypothetical protein [Bradyrhizobium sp.]|uniref:hypothetical protein n=1 Tax=Bradyrhizobium sp. TaxID=376 RepID=UPI003C6FC1B4
MSKSIILFAVVTALAVGVSPHKASADSIPGLRGHDHTGITVPDSKSLLWMTTDPTK